MMITTIGLDLAKHVFQVHGVDVTGNVVLKRRLRRAEVLVFFARLQPCLIGMEACPAAHYWARELIILGHEVRLIPPSYVKPYVRRNKNDSADAAAICEAVSRPSMRFVPVKAAEQQAVLMLHKVRELLIKQRTMLINALRCHLAEFGIIAAQRMTGLGELLSVLEDEADGRVPDLARCALRPLATQLQLTQKAIVQVEAEIGAWHKSNDASRRLATIPGIGPIIASAIAATVPNPAHFRSGREFAAWLGLVPRQNSSGGKDRLGRISRQGNRYIRRLLVIGATARIRYAGTKMDPGCWLRRLLGRKPARLASVALANKMARIAWTLLVRGSSYQTGQVSAVAAA
jgi:transposase